MPTWTMEFLKESNDLRVVVVAMMLLRLKIVRTSADLEIPRIAVVRRPGPAV